MLNPENLKFSPALLKLVGEIDEMKGAWNALERHTTALHMLGDFAGFGTDFQAVLGPWREQPITADMIRRLHGMIHGSKEPTPFRTDDFPLEIRNGDVIVGTLETAEADEVAAITPKLAVWVQEALSDGRAHPLVVIGLFMAVFLQLCPFARGNQRLIRLLAVLLMLRAGYHYAPYASLESVFVANAADYYKALHRTQEALGEGRVDWMPWLEFFLSALKVQKDRLKARIDGKGEALAQMPALSAKVMKLFEGKDRLQMSEIVKKTKAKRSTLKLRLGELVQDGYLIRHGQARSTWYSRT